MRVSNLLKVPLQLLQGRIFVSAVTPNAFDIDVWYVRGYLLLMWGHHIHRVFDSNVCHGSESSG